MLSIPGQLERSMAGNSPGIPKPCRELGEPSGGAALHLEIDASWWIQTFLMIHTLWIEILSCGHDSLAGHGCLQGDGLVVWSCLAHKISRSPKRFKAGLIKLQFDVSLLRSPPFSYHVACWWHTGGMLSAYAEIWLLPPTGESIVTLKMVIEWCNTQLFEVS